MNCPACAAAVPADARFCQGCGRVVGRRALVGHPAWKRWTMGAMVLLGTLLALGFILIPRGAATEGVAVGTLAPDFTLKTLDGRQVTLSSLRGKVVLLNFWATWCPPCREEMPALAAAYKSFAGTGVEFVSVDLQENSVTVGAFAQQFGISFPIALDSAGRVTDQYNIIPLPTTFFIGRDGRVVERVEQSMSQAAIEGHVASLLARG